jgi:NAD(P)H-dependent FMN reductase
MFEPTVLIVAGTNRPGCNALKVARLLEGHYRRLGAASELFSLADLPREIFDPDAYAAKPASFAAIQRRVLDAGGLHIVVPEYNGSFPGVLKYFIDMLKFPESFDRKPVAFVGQASGATGALRAVEQLQMVFGYRNAFIYPQRVFIPGVQEKFAPDGRLLDEEIDRRLAAQAAGFRRFIGCIGRAIESAASEK